MLMSYLVFKLSLLYASAKKSLSLFKLICCYFDGNNNNQKNYIRKNITNSSENKFARKLISFHILFYKFPKILVVPNVKPNY